MRKIVNALFLTILSLVTFSCSDVPSPYDLNFGGTDENLIGTGTKDDPYDITSAMSKQDGSTAWVAGYIVGCMNSTYDANNTYTGSEAAFTAGTFTANSNILIAASATETNVNNCLAVQLPTGAMRTALNLVDKADNLGKAVVIKGTLTAYFGTKGMKECSAAVLADGTEIGDAGENPAGGSLVALLDATNPVAEISNTFDDAQDNVDYASTGYVNFAETGDRTWRGKLNNGDGLVQATAYKATAASVISWFVTPAVSVDQMSVKKLTFDCTSAYYVNGNDLEVYFLEKTGETLNSTKLTVGTLPQQIDGYSAPATLTADLTGFAGKVGFIGFKYIGSSTATGTYQIDNLYVGKEAGGVDPDPDPEPDPTDGLIFTETFGATVSANTNVAAFTGWDNSSFTFTVADAKCNIRAKAHMTDANRSETTKVNSIWFPSNNAHTFSISGINASAYKKFIVKYELAANVYNAGSSIDLNVLKVALNDVEGTVASKVVSKDNNDGNVFFEMQAEISVAGTDNSVLTFSATAADNTMGLLLYNIRLVGVTDGGAPSASNLVSNPGFEDWTSALATSWDNATYNTGITKETAAVHGGSVAVKQEATTMRKLQQEVAVEAGKTYRISYWYLDNTPNARCRPYMYWVSGTSTLTDHADELRPGTYSVDNAEWQQFTQTLTAPATTDKLRLEVRAYKEGDNSGFIYYDDFEVVEVNQ